MAHQEQIVCDCGGELSTPLPKQCPHCGAKIVGLRQRRRARVLPVAIVLLMFALMLLFISWLVNLH